MDNIERTMNILHYKKADRLPAVHFGYWPEVLIEWAEQGKISMELAKGWRIGNECEIELDRMLGWDFNYLRQQMMPNHRLYPPFETKVLETLPDGSQRVQNHLGLIERIKPGLRSIPSEDDYLLKDRDAFEKLYKPRLKYFPERVDREFFSHFNETRSYDSPACLYMGSILGDIRDMCSLVGMSYLMYDEDEDLFRDIVDTHADLQYECIKAVFETGARFDFCHMWEDMCFKTGPLISPKHFEEYAAKHYKRYTDLCHQYGIDIVSLDCDGVVDELIPIWLENGVNTIFPIEVGVWGDQFAAARKKYGERLLGVGGMDKRVLREDKAAVDAEIERLKPIIALGGFIPCVDHNIMPGTKFELVQYYTDKIKSLKI
ncbi:MAG: hypothetical protein IKI74_00870 [Christensenellaceae bacterium]|nr:hypothetical protein [Christensenellaceae bacterium]